VRFFPISKIEYQLNLHFLATGRFCRPSLGKFFPRVSKEDVSGVALYQKVLAIALMVIGAVVMNG
jgi:hypothetical protein